MTLGDGPGSAFAEMLAVEGDTLVMSANMARPQSPDLSISAEAMEELVQAMRLWLGTRMIRKHDASGTGAQNVEVELTVRTGGLLERGVEPHKAVRLSIVDGRVRVESLGGMH